MEKRCFTSIPKDYEDMLKNIKSRMIGDLYSHFSFRYYPINQINQTEKEVKNIDQAYTINYLSDFLKQYKVIAYNIITLSAKNISKIDYKSDSKTYCHSIFCVEEKCLIIENIDIDMINQILFNLKELFLIDSNIITNPDQAITEQQQEIISFCSNFTSENYFINLTLPTIVGFWIRRNFYFEMCKPIIFFPTINNSILMELIQKINKNDKIELEKPEFQINEFIVLRKIFLKDKASFLLVIHSTNLKIYMMKVMSEVNKNEFDFCKHHSHRCFVPFYGFVKKNGKYVGFLYKYMCNGTLSSFISDHKNIITEMYSLIVICRLIQGIHYLHSNSLIHRDLKPDNILIDVDYMPYIADFETIRHPIDENDFNEEEMTHDIFSEGYSSPELYNGDFCSYPTDIYSFGQIIYSLHEKKKNRTRLMCNEVLLMEDCTENKQKLYESCVRFDPKHRPSIDQIISMINDEINSYFFLKKDLIIEEKFNFDKSLFKIFINEYLHLQQKNLNKLDACHDLLVILNQLFMKQYYTDYSSLFTFIGSLFYNGQYVKQDHNKAKEFFELSNLKNVNEDDYEILANRGDPFALFDLGVRYLQGKGVKKDDLKAKKILDLVARYNLPHLFYKLGYMFLHGRNVEKNILKAIEFFEIAAKSKYSEAILMLAYIYYYGYGIKIDYTKARKYFEFLHKQNNSVAQYYLGIIYGNGYEVEKDYSKSLEYYKLSAQSFNPYALFNLGEIYFSGVGVDKDINLAIKYFELSAQQKYAKAYIHLGCIYIKGDGVEKNYIKAKEYLELSGQKNNPMVLISLEKIYIELYNTNFEYLKSKEYYKLTDQQHNSIFLFYIMYLSSINYDIAQDYNNAKEYSEFSLYINKYGERFQSNKNYLNDFKDEKNNYEWSGYFNYLGNDISNVFYNISLSYFHGIGVKKNLNRGLKYIKLSADLNNSYAQFLIGELYYNGKIFEKNYLKAMHYYDLASKSNNSDALIRIGFFYTNGIVVKKDLNKAIECFKKAGELNNSLGYLCLGIFYGNGHHTCIDHYKELYYLQKASNLNDSNAMILLGDLFMSGPKKDYLVAKQYYESAAQLNNEKAFYKLGEMYFNGIGVKKNIKEGIKYYQLAAKMNHSPSLSMLGMIYFNGIGVIPNYFTALTYFNYAAKLHHTESLFILGEIYSIGEMVNIDYKKSIDYFLDCIKYHEKCQFYQTRIPFLFHEKENSPFCYYASNNIGIIYITVYKDVAKACEYIKYAAFAELQFGQNSFGLLNQFYLNDLNKAKYMYKRASKHNFPIAEYNLGYLYEINGKNEKAINYYIRASNDENNDLKFRNYFHLDLKLKMSIVFVLCLTNLKLVEYYFKQEKYEESKKYFVRCINLLNEKGFHTFQFPFINDEKVKECFPYIYAYIIYFPYFNLSRYIFNRNGNSKNDDYYSKFSSFEQYQNSLYIIHDNNSNNTSDSENNRIKNNKMNEVNQKEKFNHRDQFSERLNALKMIENKKEQLKKLFNMTKSTKHLIIFDDPDELFDFVVFNEELKEFFIDEIKDIIDKLSSILYRPPYLILFGKLDYRQRRYRRKQSINSPKNDINQFFYEGLNIDL